MRTRAQTGEDLFIGKKSTIARGMERVGIAHDRSSSSVKQTKLDRINEERLREQRDEQIRLTIAHRSLETQFQPIFNLGSGSAIGTEALSRFTQEPIRPPNVWFADAAALGLGVELELTALELALEQLHRLPSGLYLSLNASVETIMDPDLRAVLDSAPAERIVLELTEHTPVTDYSAFAQGIDHLRSQGVRLAVDDAGSGFSSFSHILNLKPDIIKLDTALTRGIDKDPARQALGRALLTFGLEAYRTTIVAEGIETRDELAMLRSLGCPSGQGFLLGRPSRLGTPPRLPKMIEPQGVPELEVPELIVPDREVPQLIVPDRKIPRMQVPPPQAPAPSVPRIQVLARS
jgi:EAL domain-containing protein (putative c-di-GMP-specific phosphodiesterase class I)